MVGCIGGAVSPGIGEPPVTGGVCAVVERCRCWEYMSSRAKSIAYTSALRSLCRNLSVPLISATLLYRYDWPEDQTPQCARPFGSFPALTPGRVLDALFLGLLWP